jgi:hypothetical protein
MGRQCSVLTTLPLHHRYPVAPSPAMVMAARTHAGRDGGNYEGSGARRWWQVERWPSGPELVNTYAMEKSAVVVRHGRDDDTCAEPYKVQ